jgi:hypothetical protein
MRSQAVAGSWCVGIKSTERKDANPRLGSFSHARCGCAHATPAKRRTVEPACKLRLVIRLAITARAFQWPFHSDEIKHGGIRSSALQAITLRDCTGSTKKAATESSAELYLTRYAPTSQVAEDAGGSTRASEHACRGVQLPL